MNSPFRNSINLYLTRRSLDTKGKNLSSRTFEFENEASLKKAALAMLSQVFDEGNANLKSYKQKLLEVS